MRLYTIVLASMLAVTGVSNSDLQKMQFLQDVRTEARAELERITNEEATEQAELAIEYNLACLKRAEQAKELEKVKRTIELQEEAIAKQGVRYQHHIDGVDPSAHLGSWVAETQSDIKLDNEINLRFNLGSNDGYAKPYSSIFTKTVIQPTWNKDYYDVAIPYNLTNADVGGIAIDVESVKDRYRYDASAYADRYVGERIQQEFSNLPITIAGKDREVVTDISGVDVYRWNGKNLYAIALPKRLFPDALVEQGFYPFSMFKNTGVLADLILTDGTIINCVIIDGIGEGHSNGMCEGWTASSTATAQDGVRYYLSDLKLPQYAQFFHAASCHVVEMSGDISAFREYFGFNDGVRISYIRIYKYSMQEEV